MAFVAWRTWVAGAVVTAAQLNQDIRDNLQAMFPLGAPAWTAYTPTLVQSGTVTKTVTYAKYTQVGKTVTAQIVLAAAGAGTANAKVTVTLPVTAATMQSQPIGTGYISDASVVFTYPGLAVMDSTTTVAMLDSSQQTAVRSGQTGATFSAALASGDSIGLFLVYEAA